MSQKLVPKKTASYALKNYISTVKEVQYITIRLPHLVRNLFSRRLIAISDIYKGTNLQAEVGSD